MATGIRKFTYIGAPGSEQGAGTLGSMPETNTIRVDCIVGARPNFMKMAPILAAMRAGSGFRPRLIHTGQHFSPEMSDAFFRELEMPEPDINLEVGGGTATAQTAEILRRLEALFAGDRPAAVVVVGDVTSTMAAAVAAVQQQIPVAHVEAGLRSFDRRMPEEINRILTDSISSFLFVTEPSGVRNLLCEGVADSKIHHVGNVMIDTLVRFRRKAAGSRILETLGVCPREYAVVTLHRPSNVDDPAQLRKLHGALAEVSRMLPVVFPVHPRTRSRLAEQSAEEAPGLKLIPPLGYLDFLRLMAEARLVLTDSGGIQEETTVLQVPCLTLRENTERPVTVEQGTNRLIGVDPAAIVEAARESLAAPAGAARIPDMWDGQAAGRIVRVLEAGLRG
jgi:UDP-N-acetylglucosamine 2-epimerase (non-hydrolysing)